MDQAEFWKEVQQLKADAGNSDNTESPAAPSPTGRPIFTDEEFSFESVTTLPTPLKHPRYSSNDTVDSETSGAPQPKKHRVYAGSKFVPMNDVPKKRTTDRGFNRIRPEVKQEADEDLELALLLGPAPTLLEFDAGTERRTSPKTSAMYRRSTGEGVEETLDTDASARKVSQRKPACAKCSRTKKRCMHNIVSDGAAHVLRPKSGNPRKPNAEKVDMDSKLRIKTEPGENRVKKDGTSYIRVPHDRSKGLSMTPSAVDYRERKVIQQQYQDRLATLIDEDIVNEVEAEGGITPMGRLFKASVRMLERVQLERAGVVETMKETTMINEPEIMDSVERDKTRSVSPLDAFKAKLQALINASE